MKISIVGKPGTLPSDLKKEVEKLGYELVDKNPEMVVSYGGDGTLLVTERVFPGVPKLAIKNSVTSQKTIDISLLKALEKVKEGQCEIEEFIKLECSVNGKDGFLCMNDFVIRNDVPTHALRFDVDVGSKKHKCLIGDGVVVATPFGSTGYYSSITRQDFSRGIGVAFNNLTKPMEHLVLKDNFSVSIKIKRRTGVLVADNNPDFIRIKAGDVISIKKSEEKGKMVKLF